MIVNAIFNPKFILFTLKFYSLAVIYNQIVKVYRGIKRVFNFRLTLISLTKRNLDANTICLLLPNPLMVCYHRKTAKINIINGNGLTMQMSRPVVELVERVKISPTIVLDQSHQKKSFNLSRNYQICGPIISTKYVGKRWMRGRKRRSVHLSFAAPFSHGRKWRRVKEWERHLFFVFFFTRQGAKKTTVKRSGGLHYHFLLTSLSTTQRVHQTSFSAPHRISTVEICSKPFHTQTLHFLTSTACPLAKVWLKRA